ncbi:hypothetical protein N7527_007385 [Penicillium freii]|nr:hypothetical protein N7527_007385 [Penicillium freii]
MKLSYHTAPIREPYDDEQYVITAYEKHSRQCLRCIASFEKKGGCHAMCDRGYKYARDVASYVLTQNGDCFSIVESESGRIARIEVPCKYRRVHSLLAAMEDGFDIGHGEISHINSSNQNRKKTVGLSILQNNRSPAALHSVFGLFPGL